MLVAGNDETELTMLCDRVLVFGDGQAVTELSEDFSPDDITASLFSGTSALLSLTSTPSPPTAAVGPQWGDGAAQASDAGSPARSR
jgi:hypothetical protein